MVRHGAALDGVATTTSSPAGVTFLRVVADVRRMKLGRRAIVAWLWVLVAVAGGIALVLTGDSVVITTAGVIAIILGLISLMPALLFTLEEEVEAAASDST